MAGFSKIRYYDLRLEGLNGRLNELIGRAEELSRISRVLDRSIHNNCILVGASGVGKTTLVHGWVRSRLSEQGIVARPIVELDSDSFAPLNSTAAVPLQRYSEAFESLPPCIVLIDHFGQLIYNKPIVLQYMTQLLKPLAEHGKMQLLLVMDPKELQWLTVESPHFVNLFETIPVKTQEQSEQYSILEQASHRFVKNKDCSFDAGVIRLMVDLVNRFGVLGQLPGAAIEILDESLALARSRRATTVGEDDVYHVVSDKVGIPLSQLQISDKQRLKTLETEMNAAVIGQQEPIARIVSTIQRAKLGLANPHRPLGSFLVLGPSGVGKTETAKLLAEKVFGKKESFVRIDMSEFAEAHTVARLIGAPAGYVGFEEGGGLTNAVKREPYSLVLLDEAEKAHPKIFDIFLQILDDGRLTSGQGETIDFTQTIIMATSNIAVADILDGWGHQKDIHSDDFFQEQLVPALSRVFRLEFLNRFDAILVFNPLSIEDLLKIAMLEIRKIEQRVKKHNIAFTFDPTLLAGKIKSLADPRFGARPVKRFVETTCETLVTKALLES